MKKSIKSVFIGMLTVCAFSSMLFASAAVPDGLNYQAYLSNADGSAVDASISITFAAYSVDFGGVPLWSQTDTVAVEQGLFSVTLGSPANPFPPGLFDTEVYIGLFVAGEEMLPRRKLNSVAFSFKAEDANTLEGMSAAALDQTDEIVTLEGDISTVQGDISTVQGDLATVDGRVTALEATGADITGVSAGAGLTGGGTSGNVSVGVATGGIDATMMGVNSVGSGAIINGSIGAAEIAFNSIGVSQIGANAVGTSEIIDNSVTTNDVANGSLAPADLNSSLDYTLGGLTVNGAYDLNGALTITSGADIRIQDDFNGFRWYSFDGITQYGAILARSTEFSFFDANNSRYAIHSDTNGVGIGTTLTNTGYAVSVPSLSVAGATNVGLERVSATYVMSSTSSSCHSHGNLACYYGSGTVSCPVGKRVVGGGAAGTSSALFGSISRNYPNSTTSWSCSTSYDLADITRSCFALCARLD